MEITAIIISAGITIFSLGLCIISLASFKKYKTTRLLFITFVFIILLIKGILFTVYVLVPSFSFLHDYLFSIHVGLFDWAILLLLYLATLKR